MSRLSLTYAAQYLAQHHVPDPSLAVSVVVMTAVVMAAVASPFDEPQYLLRATEESPDLADVHVCLAFFPTTSDKQSYEAPLEKFRSEPLVFRGAGRHVRMRLKLTWMEYADRGGGQEHRPVLRECSGV